MEVNQPSNARIITITHEQIAERAYAIYETRLQTASPGDDYNDWLQAEQELYNQETTLE